MNIPKIISSMTLEEKISLCTGGDFWHTKAMSQHGIPAMMMSDGPHGLRCQAEEADMIGINESLPATCFPTAVTAGATWNRDLYAAEGEAIGKEGAAAGVSVVLGPGCNIKRNPLGGRNFEYISEDPYFAGKMAAAFIRGQQSTGVSSSVKHFAVNNQEYKRQNGDSQLDERTLREIYLTPFEIAVKEGKPGTVMCSYNKINGTHASDSRELLTDILRTEWGFDGLVVTDWGALNDRIEGYKAGCDLNMPGGSQFMEKATAEAVRSGKLDEAYIDATVERILRLVEKSQNITAPQIDWDAHHIGDQPLGIDPDVFLVGADIATNGCVGFPAVRDQLGQLPGRYAQKFGCYIQGDIMGVFLPQHISRLVIHMRFLLSHCATFQMPAHCSDLYRNEWLPLKMWHRVIVSPHRELDLGLCVLRFHHLYLQTGLIGLICLRSNTVSLVTPLFYFP